MLVSIETGCVIGPRRNARRRSSFHSNPPEASTTPFVAAHLDRPVRGVDEHADHGAVLDEQLAPGARRPRLDAAVEAGPQQPAGERLAAAALVAHAAALELLGRRRLGHRLAERRLAHRDVRIGEVRRRRDPVGPLAELVERVDRALQRAAATGAAAGELGVVVGHAGHGVELHRRLGLEQLDHLGAGVDVGLDEPLLEHVARQRHDVRRCALLAAVGDADLGHVRVVRDPHLTARPRRRAADLVGLLEHRDAGPALVRGDRRRQAGGAGAQHHHVELFHQWEPPRLVVVTHGCMNGSIDGASSTHSRCPVPTSSASSRLVQRPHASA